MYKDFSKVQNDTSTEIGDTMKSYSSKYQQLKRNRSHKHQIFQVLPVKLERAAITIQRFWRHRMLLRKLAHDSLNLELDKQIQLLAFQNQALSNITSLYRRDCEGRQKVLEELAKRQIEDVQKQSGKAIKKLVGVTLQMQKQMISEKDQQNLQKGRQEGKNRLKMLQNEKELLQKVLGQQSKQQQYQFLCKIKQAKRELLRVSKHRGELQQQIRQKQVEECKRQIQN